MKLILRIIILRKFIICRGYHSVEAIASRSCSSGYINNLLKSKNRWKINQLVYQLFKTFRCVVGSVQPTFLLWPLVSFLVNAWSDISVPRLRQNGGIPSTEDDSTHKLRNILISSFHWLIAHTSARTLKKEDCFDQFQLPGILGRERCFRPRQSSRRKHDESIAGIIGAKNVITGLILDRFKDSVESW
jgi:hypothetical protein